MNFQKLAMSAVLAATMAAPAFASTSMRDLIHPFGGMRQGVAQSVFHNGETASQVQSRARLPRFAMRRPMTGHNTCPTNVIYTAWDTGETVTTPGLYGYNINSSGASTACMDDSTIEQPNIHGFTYEAHGLDTDHAGNIYTVNFDTQIPGVQVYAPGANGTDLPTRTITTPYTLSMEVAADYSSNSYIWAQDGLVSSTDSNCYEYASSTATVYGNEQCPFSSGTGIYAGATQEYHLVVVSDGSGYKVINHPSTTSPSVLYAVSGSNTGLTAESGNNGNHFWGCAVDPNDGSVYIERVDFASSTTTISEFSKTANGNVAPLKTITLSGNFFGQNLAVSTTHELYVSEPFPNGYTTVVVYSSTASGTNPTPSRTITDTSTNGWAIATTGK